MIVITSKREGFCRCGVAHAARPVEWPDERWTIDELDALLAEPMLTVEVVEDPDLAGGHPEAPLEMVALLAEPMLTVEVVEDPELPGDHPEAPLELAALLAEPMLTVEVVEDPELPGDHPEAPLEMVADEVPAAPEPYEIEFDDPDPPPAPKKAGRKK